MSPFLEQLKSGRRVWCRLSEALAEKPESQTPICYLELRDVFRTTGMSFEENQKIVDLQCATNVGNIQKISTYLKILVQV